MADLLASGDTTFKQSVSKYDESKCTELNLLIADVEAYQSAVSAVALNKVLASLMRWIRLHPQEIKTNNRGSQARELLLEIRNQSRTQGFDLDLKAADWQPNPDILIASVIEELNKCKNFICSDAAQFAGDINPELHLDEQSKILKRAKDGGKATGIAEIPQHDRAKGDWNTHSINTAHDQVYKHLAGECTSFGKAAAHLLATAAMEPFRPRIEVLAYSIKKKLPRLKEDNTPLMISRPGCAEMVPAMVNITIAHVFCVVGRLGVALTKTDQWNSEARIVDCWLGSLGYECVFSVANYPKPHYFDNLEVVMDSFQGPDAMF